MNNAVIGQSGGPTSAINATLAGIIEGLLQGGKTEKIYGMRHGIEGFLNEDLILLNDYFSSGSKEKLELLKSTPAAALGSCRKKISDDATMEKIFSLFEKYKISYFFYIGGNDSMDSVYKLSEYAFKNKGRVRDVKIIGVPKTIDNDLMETDHTPGFGSAAKYIVSSMQEIMRDCSVYKTKAITIVEIMGRDAGWLAASSSLCKYLTGIGPEYIYLPEHVFDKEKFISDISSKLSDDNVSYVVVAVSEGIKNKDNKYVGEDEQSSVSDVFGHKYLSGTGKYLENLVRKRIGCKVRSIELNVLQRCASHIASKTDIDESVKIGFASAQYALSDKGKSGMVAVYKRNCDGSEYSVSIDFVPAENVANTIIYVPETFINKEGNGITEEGIKYLLPLIKGEIEIKYEHGVPVHFTF